MAFLFSAPIGLFVFSLLLQKLSRSLEIGNGSIQLARSHFARYFLATVLDLLIL